MWRSPLPIWLVSSAQGAESQEDNRLRFVAYCGAVHTAINHDPEGYIKFITDKIKAAIGDECDPYKAACLNVKSCEAEIEASLEIQKVEHQEGLRVIGAMYHLENGLVDFI